MKISKEKYERYKTKIHALIKSNAEIESSQIAEALKIDIPLVLSILTELRDERKILVIG